MRIIRSLADVFEAIADTYRDATVVEADAKVIDAQEVKELPAKKEVTLEDVRAVLGQKSQAGMTAKVRELITKIRRQPDCQISTRHSTRHFSQKRRC